MKILFITIPWMKYYTGEGDEEKITPLSGYNFQNINGYYYGYGDGLAYIPIENLDGILAEDEVAEDVLVVWTSKNNEDENKVIGWYKNAKVYRHKKEVLTLDSDRIEMRYSILAKAKESTLLPPELRLLDVKNLAEPLWFTDDIQLLKDITMYIHNYQGEKFNTLLNEKDLTAQSVLTFPDYEMYFSKADTFLAKDLYGKAIRCFNKAIALEPDLVMAYECKGSILLSLKMYDEALEVYKKIIMLEKNHNEAYYCLGLLYGLKENYNQCISYLNKYIASNPNDTQAIAERGIAYYNLGNTEEAKSDILKAYQMDTDDPVFKKLIQYIQGKHAIKTGEIQPANRRG
ncbi:tetratricopeptide repeat protein [Cellulosilyticum sp. I15G10I2]|uniref:tetratricopeptide repeat protein n=1 Tax=Cellulosilyticum sp. I15G10I2 TaxID=1892843 RepID=UPI00085C2718|nr:tetratricopeptide repeat protein [Cellulosilyticum sp. I15G10I2]